MRFWSLFFVLMALNACTSPGRSSGAVTDADSINEDSIAKIALPDTISVVFAGDVMMGTTFPDSINATHLPDNHGANLFDDVKAIVERADFAGCNLEGVFLDGSGRNKLVKDSTMCYLFRMPTNYARNLVEAGFDFAGIANNHSNDFGENGRSSTVETLKRSGIAVAGIKGRCETAYVERNGIRFGMAQVGHGYKNVDINDLNEVRRVVKQLRDSADIVIFSFHGGAEGTDYTHVPFDREIYLDEKRGNVAEVAHAAVDAGADVVFGHGPHVVRGAELYRDHIVFYSLGNFCTPYRVNIVGLAGQAPLAEVKLDKDGKFLCGRIYSFIQQRGRGPKIDDSNAAAKQIRALSLSDFPNSHLRISPDGVLSK